MIVKPRHNHGEIILEIIAESESDRAILGMFDQMNNKGVNRRIVCGSTYECDLHAITKLYISGLDCPKDIA